MSLRLRLIVVFFLLSVVPLAAVTLFSYQSNARALRTVAQHEAELLAGELRQRMQVVTTQISERAEQLMEMSAAADQVAALSTTATPPPARSSAPAPAPVSVPVAPVAPAAPTTPQAARVADALGEVAMLFNNIEFRGMGPNDGRRGGGRPGGPSGDWPARTGRWTRQRRTRRRPRARRRCRARRTW